MTTGNHEGEVGMTSQRVSGTVVQRTIAVLGSAVFFVVAPCTLAGLVPWSITGWQLRPPFLGLELTRGIGAIMILADAARQLQTKERRPELPTRDRPWNEPRQRKWGDHEENRRAQDGNGSLHGGSRDSLRAHSK